jgi:hypothetical protein
MVQGGIKRSDHPLRMRHIPGVFRRSPDSVLHANDRVRVQALHGGEGAGLRCWRGALQYSEARNRCAQTPRLVQGTLIVVLPDGAIRIVRADADEMQFCERQS